MELRSSRRSIRSSHLTAQQRAFPPTVTAYVSSRLSSSGTGPFALRSAKKSQSERAHSNSNEIRVYHLRSGQLPAESKRRTSTSRLGHSQSAPSKLGLASSRLPSAIRDDPSYRGNIVFSSSMTRECSICIESKGIRQFPPLDCLPKCGHIMSICRSCVVRHSMGALKAHEKWHQIPCLECREPLGESYIESAVTRRDLQKLKAVAARKALEAHPRFRACLAADCSSGQIHEDVHADVVVCTSCGSKSCFNHGVPWHEGYTCDRYDDSHPDAAVLRTSEERLRAVAKKCPGEGCRFFVEKDGGCDSMWCSVCRKSWNWASVKFGGDETMVSMI